MNWHDQSDMHSLSLKVIVPSKSVKKMNFGLPFMKGSSDAETIFAVSRMRTECGYSEFKEISKDRLEYCNSDIVYRLESVGRVINYRKIFPG